MLLTITNLKVPASDLGYLLHKHPDRVLEFDLSFGRAHVFYPEAGEARCTVALLLEVDPVGLVRNRRGPAGENRALEREYLRIIYGPEYTAPENLERLRSRAVGAKRSLALREFSLGIEALQRFVRMEPLRRVHECVFAVLALESEPVDPRL
jgi:hypothetical protein